MGEKQGHTQGPLSANERDREAILDAAEEHPGSSPVWIARKIGVSKGQAYYHMTKAGYWPLPEATTRRGGRGNPFSAAEDAALHRLRMAGANPYEIGRTIGRAQSSVRARLSYLAARAN